MVKYTGREVLLKDENGEVIIPYVNVDITSQFDALMNNIYPVGSFYFTESSTCPMEVLISGSTWENMGSSIITAVNSVSITTNNQQIKFTAGDKTDSGALARVSNSGSGPGDIYMSSAPSSTNQAVKFGSQTGLSASVSKTSISVYIFKRTA